MGLLFLGLALLLLPAMITVLVVTESLINACNPWIFARGMQAQLFAQKVVCLRLLHDHVDERVLLKKFEMVFHILHRHSGKRLFSLFCSFTVVLRVYPRQPCCHAVLTENVFIAHWAGAGVPESAAILPQCHRVRVGPLDLGGDRSIILGQGTDQPKIEVLFSPAKRP